MAQWAGSISLPDGKLLTDIEIISSFPPARTPNLNPNPNPNSSSNPKPGPGPGPGAAVDSPADPAAPLLAQLPRSLPFLAAVLLDRIPLAAAAGPRWPIWARGATAAWFDALVCGASDHLLSSSADQDAAADEALPIRQLPVGILVAAGPAAAAAPSPYYPRPVTELLFYGEFPAGAGPATPVRMYAQPLAAGILTDPPPPPPEGGPGCAPTFALAPWIGGEEGGRARTRSRSPSPAAAERKKAKGKTAAAAEKPAKKVSLLEASNKELVAAAVMDGLRAYGYQQGRSRGAGKTVSEEYKGMYHQVYKGTVFAMRQHMSTVPLETHRSQIESVVDKLLCVFCVDSVLAPSSDGGSGDEGEERDDADAAPLPGL